MPNPTPAPAAAVAPAAPAAPNDPAATPAAADAATAAATAAVAAAADAATALAAAEKAAEDALAGLPPEFAWVGAEVKSLRRESANRRAELRAEQERFKNAVTAEDHEAAIAASRKTLGELTLKDALREHALPDTAAALIQGTSPEDTYARAAALAAVMVGAPAPVTPVAPLHVSQLHAGFGPQGGTPQPISGREAYRLKHKRK